MPIVDLYSSRQAEAQRTTDVWVYDRIPDVLRVQVSNIVRGALGTTSRSSEYSSALIYDSVNRVVSHEHGIDSLTSGISQGHEKVHGCLRTSQNLRLWLDVLELTLRLIERSRGGWDEHKRQMGMITLPAAQAIEELNERFRRAGFGYRYEAGKIFRRDSEFLHQETTRPALALLSDPRFKGADDEFRAAHDHLKAGENKDCAVDALNALESTMNAICDAKGWTYPKGARATDLLKILRRENLFPDFADQSFEQLLATLKSGLPALRNQAGGHGQGSAPVEIPTYVAVYALNLAASKIRFLMEAFKESEKVKGK